MNATEFYALHTITERRLFDMLHDCFCCNFQLLKMDKPVFQDILVKCKCNFDVRNHPKLHKAFLFNGYFIDKHEVMEVAFPDKAIIEKYADEIDAEYFGT